MIKGITFNKFKLNLSKGPSGGSRNIARVKWNPIWAPVNFSESFNDMGFGAHYLFSIKNMRTLNITKLEILEAMGGLVNESSFIFSISINLHTGQMISFKSLDEKTDPVIHEPFPVVLGSNNYVGFITESIFAVDYLHEMLGIRIELEESPKNNYPGDRIRCRVLENIQDGLKKNLDAISSISSL